MTSTSSANRPSKPRRTPRPHRPRELREGRIRPAKSLGQHFLTDRSVVNRIVEAAGIGPETVVVEVGPGLGHMTERLVEAAGRVIAVEVDAKLAQRLREKLPAENLSVVSADVLKTDPETLLSDAGVASGTPYIVVANLPYNIGAAVLRHFLESEWPPRSLIVMLQREVAQSITAGPGAMSVVGVANQVYATTKRLFSVSPRAFYPPPKVTSAVIRLDVRETPLIAPAERVHFFRVLRAGFSTPRKQLRNSLANGLDVSLDRASAAIFAARIDPRLRPQDLQLEDWLRLARRVEA
ncbi:MAG TPA: 16S rRNA (adenine(1518)-N(6)/adenine(1519)-N(6))-dimethyltransferase RsmA [Dehalococcoidia bacterium]|nr:16S rRNA (adenine(1518)-N(6)/adenine(1519)-N(6))-dimethyltransferase RsmA [Dehalococcoidia bacterium]